MKLLTKYNRVNIPIAIATLLISSIAYYFILHYVLVHQLDKDLIVEQQEIFHYIRERNSLPEASNYKDQQIAFQQAGKVPLKDKFTTEVAFDKIGGKKETFRRLDFPVMVKGKPYLAIVRKSKQETENIVRLILLITFIVIAFLLLVLFVANRFLLSKLWEPFQNTLTQLRQFNLSEKNKIELRQTEVDEFAELNKTVLLVTRKVNKDYESLKSFTENASHEIQTPLAIIRTKLELLSQSENLDETQINAFQSLNDAATRLSKLNQSLLLLTKIENRQFVETEHVNISYLLSRYLDNFEELAETKNIQVVKNISNNIFIEMNESLSEILISNLIINSIKHNHRNGMIEIILEEKALSIRNTGSVPGKDTAELFERFKKDSSSNDSLGLGLSIVKKICDTYGFQVYYMYKQEMHIVRIQFCD